MPEPMISPAPQDGTPLLDEYEGDQKVFRIDDGESHHYVATDAPGALEEHFATMDPDDFREFTVKLVDPEKPITVAWDDDSDLAKFPAHWPRGDKPGERLTVTATAAEWAKHYGRTTQVCSSVF